MAPQNGIVGKRNRMDLKTAKQHTHVTKQARLRESPKGNAVRPKSNMGVHHAANG